MRISSVVVAALFLGFISESKARKLVSFPDLTEIISPGHLNGVSHDQILNHKKSRSQSTHQLLSTKPEVHVLCTGVGREGKSLQSKRENIEEGIGKKLHVITINSRQQYACYVTTMLESELSAHELLFDNNEFLIQSIPSEVKIGARVLQVSTLYSPS